MSDHEHPHEADSEDHPDDEAIVARLAEAMADGRPHTFDALFDAVVDQLGDDTDAAEETLDSVLVRHGRFIPVDDERLIDLHAVLEGRWFTHTMTADEAANHVIPLRPDIDLVALPFARVIPLTERREGRVVFDDDVAGAGEALADALAGGGLTGPEGWLTATEGDTVGIRLLDGQVELSPATPDTAATAAASRGLADTFANLVEGDDDAVGLIELMLAWFLADEAALRTPHEPLIALLAAAGLESRGDYVGRTGVDWLTPEERMRLAEREIHTQVYGFDTCCHDAFDVVDAVFHGVLRDVSPHDTAGALAHGSVAEAFTTAVIGRAGHHLDEVAKELVGFADELIDAAPARDSAGALYVRAVACDCLGEVVEAEHAARGALRADPDHAAAAELMAGYLEDRGDATRAIDYLRRIDTPDDDAQLRRLTRIAAVADPKVGRNDPCPCGSGRKYKACCIDRATLPDDVQVEWLLAKATAFMMSAARRGGPMHLAVHAVGQMGDEDSAADLSLRDERFAELSLFDEGGLDWFIDEREPLLPPAEVDLAGEWRDARMGLYDVVAAEGGNLTLRDVAASEEVPARVIGDREAPQAGEHLCARLLPAFGANWLAGPVIAIPDALRDQAAAIAGRAADPSEWAEWLGYVEAVRRGADPAQPFEPHGHHHHHH